MHFRTLIYSAAHRSHQSYFSHGPNNFYALFIFEKKKSISIFLFSQNTIITAMRTSKPQQTGVQSTVKPHKWTYASAFLYSLTLITTIGKCVFILFFYSNDFCLFIHRMNDGMSFV